MAKQESIDFNTKDTLRRKQALRGGYAIVCLKCWYTSKLTQLCMTVSQTSYSTMKPKVPVSCSKLFCASLAFKFHVNMHAVLDHA